MFDSEQKGSPSPASVNSMSRVDASLQATPPVFEPYRLSRRLASQSGEWLPLIDFAAILLSGMLVQVVPLTGAVPFGPGALTPLVWIAAVITPFVLYAPEFYHQTCEGQIRPLLNGYVRRMLVALGVIGTLAFAGHWFDAMAIRVWVPWLVVTVLITAGARVALLLQLRRLQARGILVQSLAVIGSGAHTERLIRRLGRSVTLYGIFDDAPMQASSRTPGRACDGTIGTLLARAALDKPERILIVLPTPNAASLGPLLERLRPLGVAIDLCPQQLDFKLPPLAPLGDRVRIGGALPVSLLSDRPIRHGHALAKAAFDHGLGGVIALLLLPVFAAIAVAIRLDSPGPILFRQRRHGYSNSVFDIYKFRTMRSAVGTAAAGGLQQTRRGDPRVTRVGRFLRKWSLDELPQIFNVLRGEMSLVGPRPHAVEMRTEARLGQDITDAYAHRHRVKPGITGWSQIHGARGATDTVEQLRRRIELDLYYIENWSLWLDLRILLRTFKEVLRATNAY